MAAEGGLSWRQKAGCHGGRRRAVMAAEGGLFSGRIPGVTVAKGFQGTKCWVSCRNKARYSGVTAASKGGYHNGSRWGVSRRWKEVAPCGGRLN
jgi:hypothetical protein